MREIINITMDQLPHTHSGASGSMPRHTTSITSLPAAQRSSPQPMSATQILNAVASSSKLASSSTPPQPQSQSKPRLPRRPTFGRQQHYDSINSTYTQLASGIARVQAQPHKPKRPSPLHTSHSPESITDDVSTTSSSPGESSPDLCHVEHAGLGVIAEDKEKEKGNMLGLELDASGWNWYGEVQERMKEPKTPFPSPAIYA
jgi:hypothetical protein